MKKVLVWFNAVRPRTLLVSLAPVTIGIAMAHGDGFKHWPSACAALAVAFFLQIGTNLSNDYFDFVSGADALGSGRLDRVLVSKALSLREVKWGFVAAFGLAALAANVLVIRVGMPAVIILALSIIAGLWYSAGKWSLARLGLGDIFALIFFGPVATAGTYFAISYEYDAAALVAGFMPGFLSAAVLVVNNLRDIASDRKAGKLTWAVRFGQAFTRMEYLFCVLASAAVPVYFYYMTGCRAVIMVCSLLVFLTIPIVHTVFTRDEPEALNGALAMTSLFLFIQAMAFSFICLF